jgi:hypothetical protein
MIMAIVTAASGYDLGYPLRGAAEAGERTAGGYYMNAAQSGEAPGRWFGPGAAALGLSGEVDHETYKVVYGERPADPRTGEPLGSPKRDYSRMYETKLAQLMAAEPHATQERAAELQRLARVQTRQAPAYTDVTAEHGKSLSIFHGSLRENARRAREAGDEAAAAWWDAREQRYQDILQEANVAALEHLQEWAGVTRTGYHGRKVNGQEMGRWEDAELMVTSWLQGTSRAGDMNDHIHNAVHPKVRTSRDGKWRGADTMAIRNQLHAMAAVESAYVEAALTREFGIAWIPRADGIGNEIRGITQDEIDAYSSRRDQVRANLAELAAAFEAEHERKPNQRELRILDEQAWAIGRPAKAEAAYMDGAGKDARINWDRAAALWDEALGGRLGSVAGRVSNLDGPGCVPASGAPETQADASTLTRAVRQALAATQAKSATWTRADLMRQIGIAIPAEAKGTDPGAAVRLVRDLTDRALASEFELVQRADAPEAPALPGYLRRETDGRSVYTRPGADRYCTQIQLSLEERLLASAGAQSAPFLDAERAAKELGAELAELDATLRSRAAAGRGGLAGSGLRMDQAAALHQILTSPRTAEVLVGPAGSGKTRTLAEAARIWREVTGGEVIGLAAAHAARNVLAAAGVELAQNSSQFLGHAPGARGVRGIRSLAAGSLIVLDEASMMSTADLADIMAFARERGCKVIVAGDQEQLAAVEGGGGMMLLARRLGYVQLAEAVRFGEQWEREASLGLRRGELTALDEYDDHGRIGGDEPELNLDAARAAYVGHYLAGDDVLMIARSKVTCWELSRRVREDLVHFGLVDDERIAELGMGARAGAGDLIVAKRNDHDLAAGEEGRTLANGDVLRVAAVNDDGSLMVTRRLEDGGQSGEFRFADLEHAEPGYAVTGHTAQGRTVGVGLAVVTGNEGRQWFYTAMTRGAQLNQAFVAVQPARVADVSAGTVPAPELARRERIERERAGEPEPERQGDLSPKPRDARAVLADVLERDDSQESALEIRDRERSDADHLGRLDVMWQGETQAARVSRYQAAVRAVLPPGYEGASLEGGHATWLYRSLRHAEEGGLDAAAVLEAVTAGRDLTGARNVAAVLDARVRQHTAGIAPAAWRPWSERVPQVDDPVRQVFLRELAATMDERKARLGEHTAETLPAWAVNALGPLPEGEAERAAWTERASHIAAYRELYGYEHESDPLGPEPANSPEARSAWFAGYAAVHRTDEAGLDALTDGQLWLRRATYERETAWAPPFAGSQLRAARQAFLHTGAQVAMADAEARVARQAGDSARAARHEAIAASGRAAQAHLKAITDADERLLEDYREWSDRTAGPRLLAVEADAELRRRDPAARIDPLRSAEPAPVPESLPALDDEAVAAHAAMVTERRESFRAQLEERLGVQVPSEDPDLAPEGEAWPSWQPRETEAVIQPPKPLMPASSRIRDRAPEPQAEA